jgi:hypothetical protein
VRGDRLPPLVTTSPAGTPPAAAGVLGQPGTSVLFGDTAVNRRARSGARAEAGAWLDARGDVGIEGGFLVLSGEGSTFAASSSGDPILARPFTDVATGLPASVLVAFPGMSSGTLIVTDNARTLYGGNIDLRANFLKECGWRWDALLGYRYLRYDERLQIAQAVQPTGGPFAAGTVVQSTDTFGTRNVFNGIDLGFRGEYERSSLALEFLAKVAAGPISRNVGIGGSQVVTVPGLAPVVNPGGLLALTSNSGSFSSHPWTAVPELGVAVGWQVSPHVRLRTGYSVLWLLNAVRPGEQVDTLVNTGLIPPATGAGTAPARPAFTGTTQDLWVQTVNLGVEVRY